MRPRSALRSLLLGAALAGSTSCSFVLVHGPPAGPERWAPFSCTRSNALPILDALVAVTGFFVGGTLVAGGSSSEWTVPYAVVGGGFVLEGLVFGTSAVTGFAKTSRCRAARREPGARAPGAGRDPAPPTAPPGP